MAENEPPLSPEQMAARKRTNKRILIGVGFAATFLIGLAAGGGSSSAEADSAAPAPTATVTAKASPAPTVTVTHTAEAAVVTQVPQTCITALDRAEEVVHTSGDIFNALVDGDAKAIIDIDTDDFAATVKQYNEASLDCRVNEAIGSATS